MPYVTNPYWGNLINPLFSAMCEDSDAGNFGNLAMKTDVFENENEYKFNVDLPGITKENIKLSYENDYLTLEVKTETKAKEKNHFVRRERFSGTASRSFYLEGIDVTKISANFENGVLHIVVPKTKEEAKGYIVKIN